MMGKTEKWPGLPVLAAMALTLCSAQATAQETVSGMAQGTTQGTTQGAVPAWLPSPAQVDAVIEAQPAVRAAAARLRAATATQDALTAGSHEFELSTGVQRRRMIDEGRHYNEWEMQLSRAIRLPEKARLDREIGEGTRSVAGLRLADAGQRTALRLLAAWMEWLRSTLIADETAAQHDLLAREQESVARRVALGDAAQLEKDLMDAERALLAARLSTAVAAARAARQRLGSEFPQLQVPSRLPSLPAPEPLPGEAQDWQERIVQTSVAIRIASGEVARLARVADRARAERRPDPTVGVRFLSDRGGAERAVGLVVSVPFGTDYRSAMAASESANAIAAEADAAEVQRNVEQEAWSAVQAASSLYAQWQSYAQALAAQTTVGTRTRRAWELGEAPLSEHLLAQRNLRQMRLAESEARIDALQAALRVRIEAHMPWHSAEIPARPAQ